MKIKLLNLKSYMVISIIFLFTNTLYSQSDSLTYICTYPSGAEILGENNNKLGITPFDFKNIDKKTSKIKIALNGYDSINIELKEKRKINEPFINTLTGCKGCYVESDQTSKNVVFKLLKTFKEHENTVLIGIEDPVLNIDKEQILGKINGNKKRLKDNDIFRYLGYPQNMEMKILNSFNDSYINASYFSKEDGKKDVSNLQNPKIIFKPIVKSLHFELEGNLVRDYSGICSFECEWQLFDLSNLETPIKTYLVKTNYYRTGNNYELLLHEMISLSERNLLEDDQLYDFLISTEQKHLENSKGVPIKIPLCSNRSYASSAEMLKVVVSSIVTIETESKFGSGVFISDNGYLLTNYHVIEGNNPIFVKIDKEKKIPAEIIKCNKDFDLAILKVNSINTKGLSIYDSEKTSLGEDVYAIGTPLDKKLVQSISKGIISGYRELNGVDFIQTDVSINSGNSGGPLLNSKGEIIGINTLKAIGKNVSGIGFSIPSNVVLKMLNISK